MALTVNSSAEYFNFSRNPIYVEVETNNYSYVTNAGTKSFIFFYSLWNSVNGNTLTITWGSTTIVYTFRAATNIGADELAYKGGGQTNAEYISQLTADLLTDTRITNFWNVGNYEGSLFLEAKNAGTGYDPYACSSTVSGVGFWHQSGVDDIKTVIRPNYKIQVALFVKVGSGWQSVISIEKEPSANKIRTDLQRYANAKLSYDLPEFASYAVPYLPNPFKCSNVIKQFRTVIAEIFGEVPIAQATTLSGATVTNMDGNKFIITPSYISKGGFDASRAKVVNQYQHGYYFQKFLTRQPRIKKIARNQKEWLYWLADADYSNGVSINYEVYDLKGKLLYSSYERSSTAVLANEIWCFPIHNDSLGYFVNKTIGKIVVNLIDTISEAVVSESFTYIADDDFKPEETFLYFTNSDGGLDTIRLFGTKEMSSDYDREINERTETINDTTLDGTIEQNSVEKLNSYKVFSGWKTRAELIYIDELLMSLKVFAHDTIYNATLLDNIVPVVIGSKQLVPHKTNTNLFGYLIEYQEAIKTEISQANYYPID